MKKIGSILLVLVMLCGAIGVSASAQATNVLEISGVSTVMPEITVEIKGNGYDQNPVSAQLDNEELKIVEVAPYDKTEHTTCAYVLVDLSTSMNSPFPVIKRNIVSYIEALGPKDKLVLIGFGEKEVKTILTGNEDRDVAIQTVNDLRCNENGTLFYEALSKAYQMSQTSTERYDREYVLVFSDGVDLQWGSTTFEEAKDLYKSRALPMYAACTFNAPKTAVDSFGELARSSGGSFSIINEGNEDKADDFSAFVAKMDDVTLLKMQASSNHADGKEKLLTVKVGDSQLEYMIPITRSVVDTAAPTVKAARYDLEKDAFIVSFSEKVLGADAASAYKIVDARGNRLDVSGVFYDQGADAYEIRTASAVSKGEYTFEFSGITDNSKEKNPLTDKTVVAVEKGKSRGEVSPGLIAIIVGCSFLVLGLVVAVIFLSSRKKREKEELDEHSIPERRLDEAVVHSGESGHVQHHIKVDATVRIRMKIKTGRTSEQNIDVPVTSSLIVGRSGVCDIYIDDAKMSRQHFVIENDGGDLYVMDLQSRNGTMLNGIHINSRQRLNSGDKICAGLSDIYISISR